MADIFGKYSGEEVEVTFTATSRKDDYGVPGSQHEVANLYDCTVHTLTIFGEDTDFDKLAPAVQKCIMNLKYEVEFEPG